MAQYHQYTIYRQYPYSTPPEGNPPKTAPLQNLAGAKKKTLRCAGRAQGLPAPRGASAALRPGSKCGLCSVRAGVFSGGNVRASQDMADTSPRRSVFVPPWDARPVARYNSSCGWTEWEVGVNGPIHRWAGKTRFRASPICSAGYGGVLLLGFRGGRGGRMVRCALARSEG